MKIPNWLKLIWWSILVAVLTYFLWARLPDLLSGKAAAADIAVFGVWMALLLSPLFTEVALLGVTLKNEIEELKEDIATQVAEIKTEIRSSFDVRSTISPTINLAPPADSQLPGLADEIRNALTALKTRHPSVETAHLKVPDDATYLFATRYNLEIEIRRIAEGLNLPLRPQPAYAVAMKLAEAGFIDSRLVPAIRELYTVCSPAIHGAAVSDEKVKFVRNVAPEIIASLREIPTPRSTVNPDTIIDAGQRSDFVYTTQL